MLLSQLMIYGAAIKQLIRDSTINSFAIFWPKMECKKTGAIKIFLETDCRNLLVANWTRVRTTNLDRNTVLKYTPFNSNELEDKKILIQETPTDIDACVAFLLSNSRGSTIAICATIDLLPGICIALYEALCDRREFLKIIPVPIVVPKGPAPVSHELEQLANIDAAVPVEIETLDKIAEVLYRIER